MPCFAMAENERAREMKCELSKKTQCDTKKINEHDTSSRHPVRGLFYRYLPSERELERNRRSVSAVSDLDFLKMFQAGVAVDADVRP
jgi:hypothetical protein